MLFPRTTGGEGVGGGGRWWWGMVVVVVGVLTMVVVVVGGRKGFPQEVLGSHVTASDLERLMSETAWCCLPVSAHASGSAVNPRHCQGTVKPLPVAEQREPFDSLIVPICKSCR